MRRARNKVRKAFTINKPGSEDFARLIEECDIEKEVYKSFTDKGKNFYGFDPEVRRTMICDALN